MMDWLLVAPLLIVACAGLAMLLLDAFAKDRAELAFVASVALFSAAALSGAALTHGVSPDTLPLVVRTYLGVDKLSLFSDVVVAGGAGMVSLLAGGYLREHELERGEFYLLLLFGALGAMILGRGVDLLTIFIGLETMSLGTYAMIAFRRTNARAVEAAMKYFLLGSFGGALFLFGAALLYGATGHTDLAGIAASIRGGTALLALVAPALVLLISGLAFKVGAVPFHMWTPDAYEGAMTPVTTFMAVIVKSAAFVLVARVLVGALGDPITSSFATGWPGLVAMLATLTIVVGSLATVVQKSVKRMLAYSSIANAGFILLAIAATPRVGESALTAALFYLPAYAASSIAALGGLLMLGSFGLEAVSYDDLSGVGRRHPWLALPLALGALSLMGFPPTAGFLGKWYVLGAAVNAGGFMLYLALIAVLASVVGAYAYLRVLVHLYAKDPVPGAPVAIPMRSGYVVAALILASYFVFRMGLAPTAYLRLARAAAAPFFGS
jgi:NADH-quinone oxidoreductase subunit N